MRKLTALLMLISSILCRAQHSPREWGEQFATSSYQTCMSYAILSGLPRETHSTEAGPFSVIYLLKDSSVSIVKTSYRDTANGSTLILSTRNIDSGLLRGGNASGRYGIF